MAIVHDFAETYGGAERVVALMASAFPDAPVHAILGRREVAARMGLEHRFTTSLPERSVLLRHYRAFAPLYPLIARANALPDADVLISSSYAFAHAFRTANRAPQLCYCHSPLRFAWRMTDAYGRRLGLGGAGAVALRAISGPMRAADRHAAARVTRYVANSRFVADQIRRFYGRSAEVLNPPVDTKRFRPAPSGPHDDYFLFCGRLVEPYKRPTLVVEAFNEMPDRRLVVAGDGPELARLRRLGGSNVEFAGDLGDDDLIPLMQRCAAVVFPSSDDFGMIPVEAMACGRPVIAFRGGGALETVVPGATGEFFDRQDPGSLLTAVSSFRAERYDPEAIRSHAESWSAESFVRRLVEIVDELAA